MSLLGDHTESGLRRGHRAIPWHHRARKVSDRPVLVEGTVWRLGPFRKGGRSNGRWFVHVKDEKTGWQRKLPWVDGAVDPAALATFLDFVKSH